MMLFGLLRLLWVLALGESEVERRLLHIYCKYILIHNVHTYLTDMIFLWCP